MTTLSLDITNWLCKYVRESWRVNDDGTISVKGNVNIYDTEMQKLPVHFKSVSGSFVCEACHNLVSIEGVPPDAESYIFEDCLFPQEFYLLALEQKISIRNYIDRNFSNLILDENLSSIIASKFPAIIRKHRGKLSSVKFGF